LDFFLCFASASQIYNISNRPLCNYNLNSSRQGALGLDLPRRYDVLVSNARVLAAGTLATEASDHDLVWAHIDPSRAPKAPSELEL